MTRGGRAPKPTILKLIQGNPGKRPLNKREPKPARARLTPPSHISAAAKQHWTYLAGVLDRMGVLTTADVVALEALCEAYADYHKARATLKKEGEYFETTNRNGDLMIRSHPAMGVMQDADRRIRGWLTDFGMTPSARVRVKTETTSDEDDPAEKYLTG